MTVRDGEEVVASASARRRGVASDVGERPVDPDDLVGRVFAPGSGGPHPGVLVLHGSGARDLVPQSRLLASHGYAVLMLKYFGEPGLPETLDDVPLEYFDRAVAWLADREWVREGASGWSATLGASNRRS